MIHLFKKVYVASDRLIDVNRDRVVISKEHGLSTLKAVEDFSSGVLVAYGNSTGAVIGKDKDFKNYSDMFSVLGDYSDNSGKRVIIYADDKALCQVLGMWFKIILKNEDKQVITDLVESTLFKFRVFFQGRFSSNNGLREDFEIDVSQFGDLYDKLPSITASARNKFLSANRQGFGVEFLLASYLASGDLKEELKETIKVLFRKDLEKYLYELKEIFFAHLVTDRFTSKLGLDQVYTFSNYTEVVNDQSKFAQLFMSDRLWASKYMNVASASKGNIKFENLTADDIEAFKEFTVISGQTWEEESVYTFIKSDINKLDFVDILSDFGDNRLDELLTAESTFDNAAGAFFSIDLETVNHYLVQELLSNGKAFAEKFAIA